ncbi:DUF5684 domain-containing protein [Cellulomonas fengjieae]|uniref:Signal peptidase I n=1 Tax=Cellulomonas fengjieae TaxID=2819978 RepID=A0ABS3SJY4_9CELL|nr:DUF5684 domain-containing protein [Cellulomonas fengjieae]MBO3086056.1 signal peptidase I [Cellulomonas fengjieae]MBO3104006.1 signal peptidase I [Cellulomonas fengjieae]QVI65875.1 signal peptidase I [Cellulomonas fengjieae]
MITSLATAVANTTAVDPGPGPFIAGVIGYLITAFALMGVFRKAGEPVWQAFVPIWSSIVLIKVAGKPMWWIVLFLIPIVQIVVMVLVMHGLSTSFGHGAGFTVGLVLLSVVFLFILGYDSNRYQGAAGREPVGYATV